MADATAAVPSVGVWERLHCFFFAWGFPSSHRPGSGLVATVEGPSPSSRLPRPSSPSTSSQERRNSGVAPTRQRRDRRIDGTMLAELEVRSKRAGLKDKVKVRNPFCVPFHRGLVLGD